MRRDELVDRIVKTDEEHRYWVAGRCSCGWATDDLSMSMMAQHDRHKADIIVALIADGAEERVYEAVYQTGISRKEVPLAVNAVLGEP